jgi:DNA-binding transcriptional LysR family regulator
MENMDVFAIVVEHASLNKASQVLNISQPALSRKIMRLEEDLGVELFTRKGKRLELTRVGQLCYEHALELRQLERKFQQAIQEFKSAGKQSTITICL